MIDFLNIAQEIKHEESAEVRAQDRIGKLHPMVQKTKAALEKGRPDDYGVIRKLESAADNYEKAAKITAYINALKAKPSLTDLQKEHIELAEEYLVELGAEGAA